MKTRITAIAVLLVLASTPAILQAGRPPKGEGVTCICSNGERIHADRCGDCDNLCTPGFPIRCQRGPRPFPNNAVSTDVSSGPIEARTPVADSCRLTLFQTELPDGSFSLDVPEVVDSQTADNTPE